MPRTKGSKMPSFGPAGDPLWQTLLTRASDRLKPQADTLIIPATPSPFSNDPVGWIEKRLGQKLWKKQREIADAVANNRRVAVHSAHEVGKSFLAARLVCWWLDVHQPGEAFVVTTAPTGAQVKAVLWREIRRAHAFGHLRGKTNQTEWWIDGEMVAMGRKPSDYSAEAFQGIHARAVMVLIDEASGVPEQIMQAASSLAANELSRVLAIGNPDDPTSAFATICKPGSGWSVIHVNGLESPNFTSEKDELDQSVLDALIGPTYVQETLQDCGGDEDAALYVSKVLGRFPENARDAVVLLSWVRKCQNAELEAGEPIELGMDVGAGGDETIIRCRRGPKVDRKYWRERTPNWADAASLAVDAIFETGASRIKIDTIGIGWGVAGRLEELRLEGKHNCDVVPVNVSQVSDDPSRFPRLRDQLWWDLGRELSRSGGWDLSELPDKTVTELTTPTYMRDSSGRIKIEPKVDTRKKLHRSPDDADALLLAFYAGVPMRAFTPFAGGERSIIQEYVGSVLR